MSTAADTTVRTEVTVEAPLERAFAYEPPTRVCFSWDVSTSWQVETDPARTSEVDVVFTAQGPRRTHVVLTHRHLDRHGDGWEGMRDGVRRGWTLERYAQVAAAPARARS